MELPIQEFEEKSLKREVVLVLSVESMAFCQPQKLSWRQRRFYPDSVPKYVPALREDLYSQDLLMVSFKECLEINK